MARVRTAFNTATVVGRGRSRHLEVEGATYASYNPVRRFWGYAWDALAAAPLYHPLAANQGAGLRVLLIGLGGGTVLHALRLMLPRVELTAAEIDPALVDITRDHFALADTGARVVVGDGYAHVEAARGSYDVILDDAFLAAGEASRTAEINDELVRRLRAGLRAGGMVACNVFTDSAHARLRTTARALFAREFPTTVELIPALGHNAILCGLARARPLAAVSGHMRALPPQAARAMARVRAMIGGSWPAA
ncbi:MAG: fused MFS/spermidine synthase [Deltaproteobacteria bacterium]|nr:fused MFS/spermidine synthase [Deltaproteobacteria bacterium]